MSEEAEAGGEAAFIASLRALAVHPAARGLQDDAAVLDLGGVALVLTCDMIVESVHYRSDDPAGDVAWKLVAVNLSDLAAKGARPLGVLLGYSLGAGEWDAAFSAGLARALAAFDLPLLGGDTVRMPDGAPRALALTAIGVGGETVPSRSGGRPGDQLWVTGTIGDAGAGLAALDAGRDAPEAIERYRLPRPRLEAGRMLAPLVSAMMDVSDGLLLDVARLGHASGCAVEIEIDDMPMSDHLIAARGDGLESRLAAATAGDDYELLFAAPPGQAAAILALERSCGLSISHIGTLAEGRGLAVTSRGTAVALPDRLGFEHRRAG